MKNLKINKKFISLITAGAISLTMTGCSFTKNSDDNITEVYQLYDGKLENNIADNIVFEGGLNNINNLKVVNKNSKERINLTKIQVLVNENGVNTLMGIDRDLTLFLSNNIKAIYYEGKEISLSNYIIVDANGNEVKNITQLFVDNVEVQFNAIGVENNVNLTRQQIDEAIIKFSSRLDSLGIKYDKIDVLKTAIFVSLPVLSNEVNSELLNELLIQAGNPDINGLIMSYYAIVNAFNDPNYGSNYGSNYSLFYNNGVSFCQLSHLGDLVLGQTQKAIYDDINNRLNFMSTMLDTYELDEELVKLEMDIKEGIAGKGIYSNIDVGTIFALSVRFADARGMIFMVCNEDDRCITPESQKAIKYFAPYTEKETELSLYGEELYTEISNIFYGITNCKTLTK